MRKNSKGVLAMIRGLLGMYSLFLPYRLVALFALNDGKYGRYLAQFWQTSDFKEIAYKKDLHAREKIVARILQLGMLTEMAAGIILIIMDLGGSPHGSWQFGLALFLATPIVWAHLLPVGLGIWWLSRPKALGRTVLCNILEAQVRRLRNRHTFAVVAVAGSVGKTSSKIAIAKVLAASRRVRWQEGNYNDRVTVPLIFFGHAEPSIFNIPAWLAILWKNEQMMRRTYPYDVVVVELGTDGPGFMQEFAYIKPDLVVITAITPEHMEYFESFDAVVKEELTVLDYAKYALINIDDSPHTYLAGKQYVAYGLNPHAPYHVTSRKPQGMQGQRVVFNLVRDKFELTIPLLGDQGAKIALAGAAAAHMLGVPLEDIEKGVGQISAFAGRMQILYGIKNSTIIDDTYNASPVAVKAALDVLYGGDAPQRIAILGSMNELGDYSPEAHREVADYCDPHKLDLLITIGHDANTYLAPAAAARGCNVHMFDSPYDAGEFIRDNLREGAVILAKGSQNQVFAEEALKVLLADKADETKLVRQSKHWLQVKAKQFKKRRAEG